MPVLIICIYVDNIYHRCSTLVSTQCSGYVRLHALSPTWNCDSTTILHQALRGRCKNSPLHSVLPSRPTLKVRAFLAYWMFAYWISAFSTASEPSQGWSCLIWHLSLVREIFDSRQCSCVGMWHYMIMSRSWLKVICVVSHRSFIVYVCHKR